MIPRKSYDDVKIIVESHGFVLLETEYKNNATKMRMYCTKHKQEFMRSLSYVMMGRGCPECTKEHITTYTIDMVRKEVEEHGYKLLETEYKGSTTKMKMSCDKHGEFYQSLNNIHNGNWCPSCGREVARNKRLLSIDEVRRTIESKGYELLDDTYEGSEKPLHLRCHKHGDFMMSYHSIKKGHRCPGCNAENPNRNKKTYEQVKEYIESRGFTLLTPKDEYKDRTTKLKIRCNKHGEFEQSYNSFLTTKYKCQKCADEHIDGRKSPFTIESIREYVESRGYKLLDTEYSGDGHQVMHMVCPKHGEFTMQLRKLREGHGCQQCGKETRIRKNSGSNCKAWKGGITSLVQHLRSQVVPWKISQFKRAKRHCEITGKRGDIQVHHIDYSFSDIFWKTMDDVGLEVKQDIGDYSDDELESINKKFLENHRNMAKGIVMLKSIHQRFHMFCGGYNSTTTTAQLEQFKKILREEQLKKAG